MFRFCLWLISWVVENSINLVLSSLKTKLLFEDHSDTISRSDSNSWKHFFRFFSFKCFYRVELLPYCKEPQATFPTKSIMCKLQRVRPKMLPCDTWNLFRLTKEPLSTTWTNCFLSETQVNLWRFSNNVRWSIVSNSLE